MMNRLIYILVIFLLSSCIKEDDTITLPPPGDLTRVAADIGPDYNKQVYVSLSQNKQVTRDIKVWDLAFEASENGFHVFLNSGKYMFACHTQSTGFANVDTSGKTWNVDNDHLDDDSTAIGNWNVNTVTTNEVIVIDRGRVFYTGITAAQRFKKIRLESVTSTAYIFSYSDYTSSTPQTFTLLKDNNYSLVYFSFDNGGQQVQVAPPKNEWDIVFTHYTHTYYDQPVGSPYRYYLVTGALSNKWNGVAGVRLIKDSMPNFIDYSLINGLNAQTYTLNSAADFIGFDWKIVDNSFNYLILTSRYYLLKDKDGFYNKMRFIDFYNSQGEKGYITFDFQRL